MRRFPIFLASLLAFAGATNAAAQTQPAASVPPAPARFTFFVNGALQSSKQDIARSSTFSLYEEQAQVDITQTDIEGGGILDVGGSVRLINKFGVGASWGMLRSVGAGAVDGTIPHPLEFDKFRPLSASADNLEHKEQAVHVFATYWIPITEQFDVTLSAGPSFFNISQDFIRSVTFSETPPFTSVTLDAVELLTLKQNGTGYNVGIDATYSAVRMFGLQFGVGAMARYTQAEAAFQVTDTESVKIKGGGFQFGGGVRVRF